MQSYVGKKILIIEDDALLGQDLSRHLEHCGFGVTLCAEGRQGLSLCNQEPAFDLVLLDILLPGLDGLSLLGRLRQHQQVPVIMISALSDEQARISGFSTGADDYLPKPFSMDELGVRVDALLRRIAYERTQLPAPQKRERLHFDDGRHDLCLSGYWLGLTPTEYRLLDILSRHEGEVLSKPFLYQQVLRRPHTLHDRSLDMHISNVRRKLALLEDQPIRLEAVWGKGYLLSLEELH